MSLVPAAILRLQRTAGNAAVCRLMVQRFTTGEAYNFAQAERASLPPSVELTDLPYVPKSPTDPTSQKFERHHIVGDRSILTWLGTKQAGEIVPVNKWAAAALTSEIKRAEGLIGQKDPSDDKVVRNKKAVDLAYKPLSKKFEEAGPDNEAHPTLTGDEIEYTLTVLEWTPNNFVIDKEARRADPGDLLDFEALILKGNLEMRKLLVRIGIAMSLISEDQLGQLDERFKGTQYEAQWAELRQAAKGPAKVSDLFAQLIEMDPVAARGAMKESKTKKKEKLKKKEWEAALLKSFYNPKKTGASVSPSGS
jgi:hypothetical protein